MVGASWLLKKVFIHDVAHDSSVQVVFKIDKHCHCNIDLLITILLPVQILNSMREAGIEPDVVAYTATIKV